MRIISLSSDRKIRKEYHQKDPSQPLEKRSYPNVSEFSSTEHEVTSIEELGQLVTKIGAQDGCLLKGLINRPPLVKESRAGSTDSDTETEWLCLDLDGVEGYQSVDLFLADLGLEDVDYVLQWSSSMGVENKSGLRCHIFMMLQRPMHPKVIKQWLIYKNLTVKQLNMQLKLAASGNSFLYPLDITTCQNDKLLYVAPPKFVGLSDPYPGNRVVVEKRTHRKAWIKETIPSKDATRKLCDTKMAELRTQLGLEKRKAAKFKFEGSIEYMSNPEQAAITGIKVERDFVYLNLNNGDSWGYYHPVANPMFIHNFKGEPVYRTADLLPDYWAKIKERTAQYQPDSSGRIYLAFRDFRTSDYYNGVFDTGTNELKISRAKSESQLRDYMKQHGQVLGEFIPDWEFVFDPKDYKILDVGLRTINLFQPSEYFKNAKPAPGAQIPSTIKRLIDHVFVNDQATIDHFLNWLAVIVQNPSSTGTAWILHGTQGTGKGVLFHKVLKPILGRGNCTSKRMDEISSEFTGFFENRLLIFLDEMEVVRDFNNEKLQARLKNLISEEDISVRHMYQAHRDVRNFCNLLISSNKPEPIEVPDNDRRFNITPYQEVPLLKSGTFTAADIDQLENELQDFLNYLMGYKASRATAQWPLENEARKRLKATSRSAADQVTDAIKRGDFEWFWGNLQDPKTTGQLGFQTMENYKAYRELLVDLLNNPRKHLSREELFTLYEWCVGNMPRSPNKFTSYLRHRDLHIDVLWINKRATRGVLVSWNLTPAFLTQANLEVSSGAV